MANKNKKESPQLDLGFKHPFQNFFYKYRQRASSKLAFFETKKFVRSPLTAFSTVAILFLIGYQLYILYDVYNKLPALTPLLPYIIDSQKRLIDHRFLLGVPALSFFIFLFSLRYSYRTFYANKEQGFSVILITVVVVLLLTLAVLRLVSGFYG